MFNVGLSSRILLSDNAFPCAKEQHWKAPTSALFQPSGMFYRGGRLHLVAGAAATVRTFQSERKRGEALGVVSLLPALLEHVALSCRDLSFSLTLSLPSWESGGRGLAWCNGLDLPFEHYNQDLRELIRNKAHLSFSPTELSIVWKDPGLQVLFKVGCSLPSDTPPTCISSLGGPWEARCVGLSPVFYLSLLTSSPGPGGRPTFLAAHSHNAVSLWSPLEHAQPFTVQTSDSLTTSAEMFSQKDTFSSPLIWVYI